MVIRTASEAASGAEGPQSPPHGRSPMKTATLASLCMLAIACAASAAADDFRPEDRFPDAYRDGSLDAPPAQPLTELQSEQEPLRTEIPWLREDPAPLA